MTSLAALHSALAQGGYIRSVNYHSTPARCADAYERELEAYARQFAGVSEGELEAFLRTGHWPKSKPGLILACYNGYRNNYDVMRPLLERYGFTGWFFVPTEFVNTAPAQQSAFAAAHAIRLTADEYPDGRVALDWDELRSLDAKHVIASHTKTHSRAALDDPSALEREIVGPQRDFCAQLGHPVRSFTWLWGSPFGLNEAADAFVLEAGYVSLFSNRAIQRLS